ncbi:chaperone NapD [Catenovulum sp. SM1970]|uniref:chaperone NapD n=1 Tax=Marinifaba aquimaris TaxID=2741323 RepID=UPI001571D6CC|nr:chaperone NapD [Marinifaba aquimaris]NTS78092.1 chaperone NapD [Marinifaba aquimaris]
MSEYHVASYIAYAFPKHLTQVKSTIDAFEFAEVHGDDDNGRIIVTVEGSSTQDLVDGFRALESIPHMLSVSPIHHEYIEESA